MENTDSASYQRVFNERLYTNYSKERLDALSKAVSENEVGIKETLRTNKFGIVTFGSTAIGLGTEGNPSNPILGPSDIDGFVIYEAAQKLPLPDINSLMHAIGSKGAPVEKLLKENVPEIALRGAVQSNQLLQALDSIKDGDIENYVNTNRYRLFLNMLTATLVSPHFGDSSFIKGVRGEVIQSLQGYGDKGEKLWTAMNQVFKEHYVQYGDSGNGYKRQVRREEAVSQIYEQRAIPKKKYNLADRVISAQQNTISLPPLADAMQLAA